MTEDRQRPSLLDLSIGHPYHAPPPAAIAAATSAPPEAGRGYSPPGGLPALRQALQRKLAVRNRITAAVDDIIVTAGSTLGLYSSLAALTSPGTEILVPDPGFPLYRQMAAMLGLRVLPYRVSPESGVVPDLAQLPPAPVMIWNSPHNPTGLIADPASVERLAEQVTARKMWLISDEAYEDLVFDGIHVSPGSICPERTYTIHSFSKGYGMAGWRIGYVTTPPGKGADLARLHWTVTMSVSTISQIAALAALDAGNEYQASVLKGLQERLGLTLAALNRHAIPHLKPAAGLFVWVDIRPWGSSTAEFVKGVARSQRVLISPGTPFGPAGEGHVRLSFSLSSVEMLQDALERFCTYCAQLRD